MRLSGPVLRRLAALACLAPLAACDLGPDYRRPDADMPASWRAVDTSAAIWPSDEWWRGFRSPELDQLVAEAATHNQDIAAAMARIRQADAQVRIAGAPLLPTVDVTATGNYQRSGTGSNRVTGTSGQTLFNTAGSASRYTDFRQYSTAGNISYFVDFWGAKAAALEAARSNAVFSRFDKELVALTVLTNVATTWFTALNLQDRLSIAERNLADSERTLKVIQARLEAGTASALDVSQQAALVAGQRANIPNLRSQLEQELIGLGILVGRPPETIAVRPGTLADLAQPPVAPGLPSEVLTRRPDVAEAEAELVAANANIKAARAAFFPAVQLTGSAGFQSLALNTLFGPGASVIAGAANLTQPIFDAGTLRGQLEQARGRYDELLAGYRKSILQAFTDVEDAETALRFTAEQLRLGQDAVYQAQRAADIARAQLAAGTVDVTTVLTTELTLYSDQDTLEQVRLAHFLALLNLYRALGGGWSQPVGPIPAQFPGLSPGLLQGGVALPIGDNVE
jgi:NodT family efflux transporter outer membrane factor (OMF) lipoprotein